MHDAAVRRTKQRQTAKDNQFSAMPHQGRTPIHGGGVGVTGSCSKEAHHNYKQPQLPRPPGAPMAPRPDMPGEAEASSVSAGHGSAWVKPGCMMELTRLAKIPQPESGLMCPRCHSTETKFCYYNNYSLSQPRHFCRACRRYWTHGGALRDLPFCSGIRRRRNKPSNKHNNTSSKAVACCGGASGAAGRASPSSSSSGAAAVPASGRMAAAAAAAILQPPEQLPLLAPLEPLEGVEHQRTGASRLWFPGQSSLQDPLLGYHHQLGNGGIGACTSTRLEHQCYLPQRQQCSLFLGYKNAVTAAPSSAIGPFSAEDGGAEAVSFAGQMEAISISRLPAGSAAASENAPVEKENPPIIIPSTAEMMMGRTLTTSSPREFLVGLQGDHDLLHFLGSRACGYGCTTAGNNGSSCTVVAPGSVWAYPSSGFTSSCSASGTL